MTRMAYCTPVDAFATIELAEVAAIARHSHYYTDVAGWVFRADVVSYSYTIDADREEYGTTAGRIEIAAYPVLKWTEHGATLKNIWSGARRKWTDLRPNVKQFASRTAREAIAQLRERRQRQLWVLSRKQARAEYDLQLAERALYNSEEQMK